MRTAALIQPGQALELREMETPSPRAGEVLVRISKCGLCHSDLHIIDGDWPVPGGQPLVPGHEGVGRIANTGHGVTGWAAGDRVGVPLINHACGVCSMCAAGVETLCENIVLTGFHVGGCFAEYALIDSDFAVPLPDEIDDEAVAPILCAGVTVFSWSARNRSRAG